MGLELVPIHFSEAAAFVDRHHRHHQSPVSHKFSIGLTDDGERICGVIIVGRPVSRHMDDGKTAEVTRCCVLEGVKNGCSKLYGAAWRAAKALGYCKLITYTLASESGSSLSGAGWTVVNERAGGGSWSRDARPRVDKHPTQTKLRWEVEV